MARLTVDYSKDTHKREGFQSISRQSVRKSDGSICVFCAARGRLIASLLDGRLDDRVFLSN